MKSAVLVETQEPKRAIHKAAHIFYAAARIDGKLLAVRLTVLEDQNGHRYYDQHSVQIETPAGEQARTSTEHSRAKPAAPAGATIDIATLLAGVKPDGRSQARVGTLTPAARRRRADIERMLTNPIRRIVGPEVTVRFADVLGPASEVVGWGQYAQGKRMLASYTPADRLIELSFAAHDMHSNAYHEAFHDIEAHLLTARELELMTREADRLRDLVRQRFGFTKAQVDGMAGYEIRAQAFEAYVMERETGRNVSGLHIGVRNFFERLFKLFRAIRNGLAGYGFQTAEDIFGKAYGGEFASRPSRWVPDEIAEQPAMATVARPRSAPLPVPQLHTPHESVRDALNDPNLSRMERLSAALDALLVTKSRALWDKLIDLSRLQKAAEAMSGSPTEERLDTYLAASLYPGRAGERLSDVSYKLFRPLYDAMAERGFEPKDLHEYLYARHAKERNEHIRRHVDPNNDMGSGMTDGEADTILDRIRTSGREADYQAVARYVDDIVRHNRELMEEEGLEDTETLMRWANAYQHYVPLKSAEVPDGENHSTPPRGKGFNVRGPESKRALGRYSKANNILAHLLDQTQRTVIRAEKNRVGKTFLRFAQRNPSPLYTFGLAELRRQANPTTGLVETVWVTTSADADKVFAVKVGGQTYYVRIEHEGLLLALKNLGVDQLPSFLRPIAAFTRQYAAFQTARNPEFVFTNLMRDLADAGFSLTAEQQKGFRRAFVKNIVTGRSLMGAVLGQAGKTESRLGRL